MPPPTFPACRSLCRRDKVVALALLGLWLLLAVRLLQLHLFCGPEFARLALRQRSFREAAPARPGDIVDRNGRLFATSVAMRSLYIVPCKIAEDWHVSQKIAAALALDADHLFERIAAQPGQQFLWVKRRISDVEARRIRELKLPAGTWGFREEYRRHYPQGELAAHVVGLRGIDGRGQGGVEQSLNDVLRGEDGYRELTRDATGRVIDMCEDPTRPPRHGQTVVLTLDAVVQVYVERALDDLIEKWKPRSCCALVLDPKSGDLLAMASRPAFNPSAPETSSPEAWKNRTISDIYEPGSTFKPFVVAWALKHGVIERNQMFDCEHGEYRIGHRVLHDHHPYGTLSVVDILVKSSNIGMAKIGMLMTNPRLYDAAVAFGFGAPTGIELPGELPGIVRPLRQWNSYSLGSVPMGQEIAVTPLQMLTAYAALSNGGRLATPRLVLNRTELGESVSSTIVSRVLDPELADWIRCEALTAVIRRGTGKKADLPGFQVFGKTGTAQKPDPVTGQYSNALHVSSFICGAPASAPRVLVLVSVDEPSGSGEHFGGSVAAPTAGRILREALLHLGVAPVESVADSIPLDTTLE